MNWKRLVTIGLVAGLVAVVLPIAAQAEDPVCDWLAGDFHVHTTYSHDSYGGPGDDNTDPFEDPPESFQDFLTFGWPVADEARIAESRGLDYITITDHDDVDSQRDPAWGTGDLIWVPNYENTVGGHGGHAQMTGARFEDFPLYESVQGPEAAAQLLRERGGAFQINHPSDAKWHNFVDADGDGKEEFVYKHPGFAPDALEIWNIGVWLYHPPAPATNDHEFPLGMYDYFLDEGFQVAATGGSDSHWRSTTAVQGMGQPTTWVCASESTTQGVIDAVKAGRTTISDQPPAYMGAFAYLEADSDGDGVYEAMLGDTVEPGSTIRAVVEGAAGSVLRLVTNGGQVLAERDVNSFNFQETFSVPESSTWVRAEVFRRDGLEARQSLQSLCDASERIRGSDPAEPDSQNLYCSNRLAVVALTSAIYLQEPEPSFDSTTTLTYVGDTTVQQNKTATFAAILADSAGSPLAGQTVAFTFRGVTLEALTDESGLASVQTRVSNPRGTEMLHVDFAGTDTYSPSHIEQAITITNGRG